MNYTQTFVNEYQSKLNAVTTSKQTMQALLHNVEAEKCLANDDFVAITESLTLSRG
jgi:hypothetical protein